MEYVGYMAPGGYDEVVLRGDGRRRRGQFTGCWLRGQRVVAGMHVNDWDATDHIRRVVGTDVDAARLADENVPLADL